MENKTITLKEINSVHCMEIRDAIQLMIRVADNIMKEEDELREEWGDRKMGVKFPDFNIDQPDVKVRIYVDMEGDV